MPCESCGWAEAGDWSRRAWSLKASDEFFNQECFDCENLNAISEALGGASCETDAGRIPMQL
jgi:hypothetical protein